MIDSNVIICHAARREALLEPALDPEAIQCTYLRQTDTSLIDIVDDHARDTLVDHLRDRAGTIGEYRGSARHCLNHEEAERLRPANGKQQCSGVPKERPLLFLADLADELDAVGRKHRLHDLAEIRFVEFVHLGRSALARGCAAAPWPEVAPDDRFSC
jgi:hypothetical protein